MIQPWYQYWHHQSEHQDFPLYHHHRQTHQNSLYGELHHNLVQTKNGVKMCQCCPLFLWFASKLLKSYLYKRQTTWVGHCLLSCPIDSSLRKRGCCWRILAVLYLPHTTFIIRTCVDACLQQECGTCSVFALVKGVKMVGEVLGSRNLFKAWVGGYSYLRTPQNIHFQAITVFITTYYDSTYYHILWWSALSQHFTCATTSSWRGKSSKETPHYCWCYCLLNAHASWCWWFCER